MSCRCLLYEEKEYIRIRDSEIRVFKGAYIDINTRCGSWDIIGYLRLCLRCAKKQGLLW